MIFRWYLSRATCVKRFLPVWSPLWNFYIWKQRNRKSPEIWYKPKLKKVEFVVLSSASNTAFYITKSCRTVSQSIYINWLSVYFIRESVCWIWYEYDIRASIFERSKTSSIAPARMYGYTIYMVSNPESGWRAASHQFLNFESHTQAAAETHKSRKLYAHTPHSHMNTHIRPTNSWVKYVHCALFISQQ